MLEPLVKTIEVPCNQQMAFEVFVLEMSTWWPLDKRSMSKYAGSEAEAIKLDARVGGKIVEVSKDGNKHHWGTFRQYDPFGYVNMDFHMGLPPEKASTVEVSFEVLAEDRTRVQLTQSNWEAFGDMADMMYSGYGSGWVLIFEQGYRQACENRA